MFALGTPLKHQITLRFPDVFRGSQKGKLTQYGLILGAKFDDDP